MQKMDSLSAKKPKFMKSVKKSVLNHNFIVEIIIAYGIWALFSQIGGFCEELLKTIFDGLTKYNDIFEVISRSILCIFSILYCVYIEKRSITSMGIVKTNIFREVFLGFVIGALYPSLNVLPYMLSGMTITIVDINITMIVMYLIFTIIQASGEELFFRGYLMVSLTKKYSLFFAVIMSSLFFAVLHPGFINQIDQFIVGLLLCIFIIKRKNIYGACVLHGINNFFLVNVYGDTIDSSVYSIFEINFDNYVGSQLFDLPYYIHILRIFVLLIVIFIVPENEEKI